jgi:hypothetical protein
VFGVLVSLLTASALCLSVRFLYVFVDKDRTGFMTATQFQDFLEMLHPYEKLR